MSIILITHAQSKLIATSYYNHDTTGFSLLDTSKHFYSTSNNTTVVQDYNHNNTTYPVFYKSDSSHLYHDYGTGLFLGTRLINTYNANYDLWLNEKHYSYDNNNVYTYYTNWDHFYTSINLDSSIGVSTNIVNSTTYNQGKQYYHYNAQNQVDTSWVISFNTMNGQYAGTQKLVSIYTGNLKTSEYFYQSADSINYTPLFKKEHYYNANNNVDSTILLPWSAGNYVKSSKNVYSYNANQYIQKLEGYLFSVANQSYQLSGSFLYIRPNGTSPDTIYTLQMNTTTMVMDTVGKSISTYQGGLIIQIKDFLKNSTTANQWQYSSNGAIKNFYYDMIPNTINEKMTGANELIVYPNPVESNLFLNDIYEGSKYIINDMQGNVLQSGILTKEKKLNVFLLPSGVYSLKVETTNKIRTCKFIKL